jgi:hypothetical protein
VASGADVLLRGHHHRQTHQPAHHQRDEAQQIVEARNNSERQPVLNLQIAKAYLAGTDNGIATRTWQQAIESLASTKQGANQHRWRTAAKDKAFVPLMPRIIIETPGELLLKVLQTGKVSTNVFLRACTISAWT